MTAIHSRSHALDQHSLNELTDNDDSGSTRLEKPHCWYSEAVLILFVLTANGCGISPEIPTSETPGSESVAGISSNVPAVLYGDDSIQARAWAIGASGDSLSGVVVTLSALTPGIATLSWIGVIHTRANGLAQFLATTEGDRRRFACSRS